MGKKTKAKKKADVMPETKAVSTELETTKTVAYTFISRDKSAEMKLSEPVKKNKASEVVFAVLGMGDMPKGLKLQYADSYGATFINRKGKNSCGSSNINNLLVINGIADELEAIGVKGVIQPTRKPYRAIKLDKWEPAELKDLAIKIAKILGFEKSTKKAEAKAGEETVTA